jgi:hypothetical protein
MADLQVLPQPLSARAARPGSRAHALLRLTRKVHLYFGVFISPALLFFAFTGALQTFSLHETTQGSNYKPPAWIASIAQLHKKQTTEVYRRPRPNFTDAPQQAGRTPSATSQPAPADADAAASKANSSHPRNPADHTGDSHKDHSQQEQASPNQAQHTPSSSNPANATPANRASDSPPAPRKNHMPMKIFFLIVSIGLFLSTITGIYMSYKYTRKAWLITVLLIAGTVLPLLLLPF